MRQRASEPPQRRASRRMVANESLAARALFLFSFPLLWICTYFAWRRLVFPRCGALEEFDHRRHRLSRGRQRMNALKAVAFILIGIASISTSSATRIAASRTKSVRERLPGR